MCVCICVYVVLPWKIHFLLWVSEKYVQTPRSTFYYTYNSEFCSRFSLQLGWNPLEVKDFILLVFVTVSFSVANFILPLPECNSNYKEILVGYVCREFLWQTKGFVFGHIGVKEPLKCQVAYCYYWLFLITSHDFIGGDLWAGRKTLITQQC